MSANLLPRTVILRSARTGLARPSNTLARQQQVRFESNGPTAGTTGKSSEKGPMSAEQRPQGSDKRGTTTTYALPVVAVALVAFALTVRLTKKETKQDAINVGVNTSGLDKLESKSKSRGVENAAKANAEK
ncbi:hypothetical protein CBS101457_005518 [Exobasidium rhododendri]|nr:hypothetical protein CBS101457_005518 [Exobasidium rhododendri]